MPAFNPYLAYSGYSPYQQTIPQNQNGSFIHVPSENHAREWPVAPGNSVTFIDDNAPYCYTKSMGISQFDSPVFKRFRLVEEDATQQNNQNNQNTVAEAMDASNFVTKSDLESMQKTLESGYLTIDKFEPFKKQLEEVYRKLEKLKELTD